MNVFFDLDGVLLDTEKPALELWKKFLGEKAPYLWWECLGVSIEDEFKCFKDILKWDRKQYDEFKSKIIVIPKVRPDTVKVLTTLKRGGHNLTLVTSSSRESTYEKLNFCELTSYFDFVVTAEDVNKCKPYADPYELAISLNNATSDNTFVVEDSVAGTFSACRAKLKNIIFY